MITTRSYNANNEEAVRLFVRATAAVINRLTHARAPVRPLLAQEYKADDLEIIDDMLTEIGGKVMPRAPYPTVLAFENTIRTVALTTPEVARLRAEDMIEP